MYMYIHVQHCNQWPGVHISDICTVQQCMIRLQAIWLKYSVAHIKGTAWHWAINTYMRTTTT